MVLLFTLTFKTTYFDTLPTLYLNEVLFKIPQSIPTPSIVHTVDINKELKAIEELIGKGELLVAKDKLERLLASGITGRKIHFLLGLLYEKMAAEYMEKAKAEFRMSVLYKGNEASSFYELGKIYFNDRDYQKAIENFLKAELSYKDDPVFLKYLGISYLELGEFDKAKKIFSRVKKLAPKDEEVKTYLSIIAKFSAPPTPTSTPTFTPVSKEIEAKNKIASYFDNMDNYKDRIEIISEKILCTLSTQGDYVETVHRLLFVKDPSLLQEGLKFAYDRRYVEFSLYLLNGVTKDKKQLGEKDFDYFVEEEKTETGILYENAVIRSNIGKPILLEYKFVVKVKTPEDGKFHIFIPSPRYPTEHRAIDVLIPQGVSFNIYPKYKVNIEDNERYKRISLKKDPNLSLTINNFIDWKDLYTYLARWMGDIYKDFSLDNTSSLEGVYNTFISSCYNSPKRFLFLFSDHALTPLYIYDNLLFSIALFDIYKKKGMDVDLGFIDNEESVKFPSFDPGLKGVLFLDSNKFLEPNPFTPFGTILPEDIGKDAFFITRGESLKLSCPSFGENVREDYVKINLEKPESAEVVFYMRGLYDLYYRRMLYNHTDVSVPELWFFDKRASISHIETSDIKRLDIPLQIAMKVDLKQLIEGSSFHPPYILPYREPGFPYTVRRRIEVNMGDYTLSEVPQEFFIENDEILYRLDFSYNKDIKKLIIENRYISKTKGAYVQERDLSKVMNLVLKFVK